jgi:hypothetical protein
MYLALDKNGCPGVKAVLYDGYKILLYKYVSLGDDENVFFCPARDWIPRVYKFGLDDLEPG